jgi:hypothetical protein
MSAGTFTMNDGEISGNTASSSYGAKLDPQNMRPKNSQKFLTAKIL